MPGRDVAAVDGAGRTRLNGRQIAVIEAITDGATIKEAAEKAGVPVSVADQWLSSISIVTAVLDRSVNKLTTRRAPRAIAKLDQLMDGYVKAVNMHGVAEYRAVRPEVQLAAAQAILKIARIEEHVRPPDRDTLADLSTQSPDQLRAFIAAAEERLAAQAQDVSAPDAPDDARHSAQSSNPYSMLD